MPTYETSCRLPANMIWCLIHKKHVKAQAINFFGCLYNADGVHADPGKVNTVHATFQWVKEAVISDTTLRYFDPSLPVIIQVDASQVGLGAALLQNGKPVAFASKALTKLNTSMPT